MSPVAVEDFAKYLANKNYLLSDMEFDAASLSASTAERSLRKLWESTELTANGFADEVAQFYGFKRLTLPQLGAAPAFNRRCSPRFLRDTAVFPFEMPKGHYKLAVADPSDAAAVRAAEIVLGAPVLVEIASFEDIATVRGDETAAGDSGAASARAEDDIENLRDLASGAPVVRAVNDLLEKALELRASDIHIEPFRNGLVVRMRVDGLLRAVAAPADALPQALISRIKILAGLNIAERR